MTRLLTTGYETGDINEAGGTLSNQALVTSTVVSSGPTPRSPGTYCYKIAATQNNVGGRRSWTLPSARSELWVRLGVYLHSFAAGATGIVGFYDSTPSIQGCVSWTPSDQLLRVHNGGTGGTLLGTSALTLAADTWYTLEVRWQITSTSSGTVEVWVDGARWLNLTGVDNTLQSNVNMQNLYVGCSFSGLGLLNGGYFAFDDLALNDTNGTINNGQIGDGRIVLLKPNGAGSNAGLTRGGADSGANWSQVDELPPSMTDYVYSATVADRDLYAIEDMPSGSWSVNCVEVLAYAQNSDAGAGSLGLTLKSGATTNEGTAQSLTSTAAYYRQLYETDPATSVAWTNAAVNALEAGTTVR